MAALKEFVEWDVSNWGRALDYWESNTALTLRHSKALEIGGRHGGLSLWLAQKQVNVTCSDLEGPSDQAKEKHKNSDHLLPIEYASINALDIPFKDHFDIVLFKSVLGSVGRSGNKADQAKAIQEMHGSLKSGGELWFAENLVASPMHRFLRKKFVPWGEGWRYIEVSEMMSFLSAFSKVRYVAVGFLGALGRSEQQRKVLGNLDKAIVDKLVPEAWKYIMIGVATK